MINLKIKTNGTVRNLTLPYPGQSIPDIIEKNSVVTVSEVTEPESLKYMEGHEWNIDEINFLAKRMESFDKREKRQFDAIASQLKPSTGQDLINQTFNLSRYTLISDFSSLTEIGKTHIINRKQAMSFDEMASTDFAKIGKDLIESGKGIPTAYGVMFINEDVPMDIVYTDKVEPFGMDECWLQLWGKKYDEKDGKNTANAIRDRIKVELGITVSVGVSFNKVFAKLGSDLKKPDAVTVVQSG